MAESKIKTSLKSKKQSFFTALKTGKPQDLKIYIVGIKQMDPDIETIVAQALSQVLVEKKLKNPTWFLQSLNFYKELFICASMDYITNDQYFPSQIHEQIVRICTYRPQIENTQQRGKQYFVEVCKYQKTQQNGNALEKIGCNYVEFALELLQSFAQWFPMDYQDPRKPSFFSKQYQKLIANNVKFPKKQAYQFIKKNDYQNFKNNYKSFIESLQEDGDPKQQEPEKNNSPSNINKSDQNNGPNMIQVSKKQLLTSKIPTVPPQQKKEEKKQKDPSMIALERSLLKTNEDHKTAKNNPTLDAKLSQNPKESISKIAGQADSQVRKTSGFPQEKRQIFERSLSQSEEQLPKIPSKKQEKKPAPLQKVAKEKQKIQQIPKSNKVQKNDIKKEVSSRAEPPKKIQETKPSLQSNTLNIPVLQTDFNIPSSKIQVENPKKAQQPSVSFSFAQPKPIISPVKQQDINNSKFKKPQQMSSPYSFNQKSIKKQDKIQDDNKKRQETPRKIPKIQKPSFTSSPSQQYPNTNRTQQMDKNSSNPNQRPRSMPKTERRQNTTKIEFYNNFSYTKPDQFFSRNASPSKQFNKTLSYWANNRSKNPMSRQLQKACSIAEALNDMRLDQIYLPFQPKYFQPVTIQMHTLRSQSLNLVNSGRSHAIFYSNRIIQCRLIKDMRNIFTLIVHNITNDTIEIDYQDMKNIQYCKKIKILSWGNRIEIGRYALPKNGYMDIKFKFQTKDFNFKFLPFLLKINQRIEKIMLPITLIDMCNIQKINPLQLNKFSLKGSIINSQPFTLQDKELPMFLGGFKFPSLQTSRERKEKQVIIGTCTMTMQKMDQDGEVQVFINVIVRITSWEERKVQISIIYQKKNQDCENFAKIIMYHLKFLTKEPQK